MNGFNLSGLLKSLPGGVIKKGQPLQNKNIPHVRYETERALRQSGITNQFIINGIIDDLINELKKPKSPSPMKTQKSPKCPLSSAMKALKIKHGGVHKREPTKQELQRKQLLKKANDRRKQKEMLLLMSGLKM